MNTLRFRFLFSFLIVASILTGNITSTRAATIDSAAGSSDIQLVEIGRFFGGGAEISAYDPATKLLFVTGGFSGLLQVVDLSDPTSPVLLRTLALPATSVAVRRGILAVAVPAYPVTNPGQVYLFSARKLELLKTVQVGALPDMLTFTLDGKKILVANEGEPDVDMDPEGSVSVIDLSKGLKHVEVRTATFKAFNKEMDQLIAQGVRIFPGAASVAQDLEPEYIALSPNGAQAWVTLQENNAVALLDVAKARVVDIFPLGLKDYSSGPGLDASDRDGPNGGKLINIRNWPVLGMYMPDGIASFSIGKQVFYITANEGDSRGEEKRIGNLALDPAAFPDAAGLQANVALGRLNASTIDGDRDGDGDYDQLYVYGGRSFSIWDSTGSLVFDSGDQLEQTIALLAPSLFNANDGNPAKWDERSDDKGPEPEAVVVGVIDERTYAFVGLERAGGGAMVFDVSDPSQPEFVQYVRSDQGISTEGLLFVPAHQSPNGLPLLILSHEISGNVTIYQIQPIDG